MDLNLLIDEFIKQTGDTPSHILVTKEQYEKLGITSVEHSVSCVVDILYLSGTPTYHYPEFPVCLTIPQVRKMKFFKIKDYEVGKVEKFFDWCADHYGWVATAIIVTSVIAGLTWIWGV